MNVSTFEVLYFLSVGYFIWIACAYSFKKNLRYKDIIKKFNISDFHLYFPFFIISLVLIASTAVFTLTCLYYISVIVIFPLFCLVIFLTVFFVIFTFISGTIKLSIASLLYISFFTFLLIFAHSNFFRKIYLLFLKFVNSLFNSEFSNDKTILFSNYINNKNYLSLQVYFVYGLIYLVVNIIKFTEGMFNKVYTFTSNIIDKIPFLIDLKKELLDILTVILTTEYLLEALVTFAIFDLIIKEIKHIYFNKNDSQQA